MDIFTRIKSIGKTASIAKIGGFRPETTDLSWFGGNFLFDPNTPWPEEDGIKLIPILQIYIPDIENGRDIFGDYELAQIFINVDRLNHYIPKNGEGWRIVFYKEIKGLVQSTTPDTAALLKPFPVRWSQHDKPDYPCWEESWEYADMTEINNSKELSDRFFDEFTRYYQTKIGGYASYIQSPISKDYEFILQISSEPKPGFMIGDNGNIYIYRSKIDNEWYLYWDCY
ncbi:DUF1963 domain-containing protein [Cohnella terricola]|uniref:DUF1963 domain-containing protein n=1 Tax=Cohnella terricola TaxID=1289167 RepID=A0A559J8S6_9BACL|nr:DUF1963 domain-containing protein [Cohnella terricola]TVX96300.1 DUF1963 domain-containing protein [Cohnella terricola]